MNTHSLSSPESSSTTRRPGRYALVALLIGLPAISLGVWSATPWWTPQPDEILHLQCASLGTTVTVDVFWPQSANRSGKHSAILLLPGVEGALYRAADHFSRARRLANDGHAVFVVHYLEPCGYEHLYLLGDDGRLDAEAVEQFIIRDRQRWIAAVTDTLAEISRRPEIDRQRLGLLGYSLGCFVAISVADAANRHDDVPNVVALAGNWGAKFDDAELDSSFPPCRFFHGQLDSVVPVAWAQQTVAELEAAGVDATLQVFAGEPHIVRNRLAWHATREFFRAELQASIAVLDANWPHLVAVPMIPHDAAQLKNLCF